MFKLETKKLEINEIFKKKIVAEKKGVDFIIKNISFLSSHISTLSMNHLKYKTPFNLTLFQDGKGNKISTNCEYRKKKDAKKYFNKLIKFVN